MQYQHLVLEEFARRVKPLINPFIGTTHEHQPAITPSSRTTGYRLGHSSCRRVRKTGSK